MPDRTIPAAAVAWLIALTVPPALAGWLGQQWVARHVLWAVVIGVAYETVGWFFTVIARL
jgi:hypothetical protein